MARYKFPRTTPPGGWVYLQRETRLTIKGESLEDLTAKVMNHRRYKGLPVGEKKDVALEIERQICTRLDDTQCRPEGTSDEWVPIKTSNAMFDPRAMLALSRAAITWIADGRELVPMEEAERRRGICAECPLNSPVTGCKCGIFYNTIAKVVPKERRFADLHVCAACQCSLQTKASLPLHVIEAADKGRDINYPVHCWIRQGLSGNA